MCGNKKENEKMEQQNKHVSNVDCESVIFDVCE